MLFRAIVRMRGRRSRSKSTSRAWDKSVRSTRTGACYTVSDFASLAERARGELPESAQSGDQIAGVLRLRICFAAESKFLAQDDRTVIKEHQFRSHQILRSLFNRDYRGPYRVIPIDGLAQFIYPQVRGFIHMTNSMTEAMQNDLNQAADQTSDYAKETTNRVTNIGDRIGS